MKRLIPTRWDQFRNDISGAAAVEFAIVVFPFIAMVGFLMQMAVIFFWTQMLEVSTRQGSRAISSGSVQAALLTAEQFKSQNICAMLLAMSCDDIVVQVRGVAKTWDASRTSGTYSFIDMNQINLTPPAMQQSDAKFCPGGPGDLIVVDTIYKMPITFGWIWPSSATMQINGVPTAVIRWTSLSMNEPFTTAPGTSCLKS